jgi:hypothetical protein
MKPTVIVWDVETVPDLGGFAAAKDLAGKSDVEVREAIGDKFPKHIYHSIRGARGGAWTHAQRRLRRRGLSRRLKDFWRRDLPRSARHPRNSMSIALVVVRAQCRAELMATLSLLRDEVAELRKELAAACAELHLLRAAAKTRRDPDEILN